MLRHVIAPVRSYTKASNDVVRHPRLNVEAKLLIVYMQGLPESDADKPLSEHAAALNLKPCAFKRAKKCLIACGYFHQWKWQGARGHWFTDQLFTNVTLTREEANAVRDGRPPTGVSPTVGSPDVPRVGCSPTEEKDQEKKNLPHPPPERPDPAPTAPDPAPAPEPDPVTDQEPDPGPSPEPAVDPEPAPDPAPAPEAEPQAAAPGAEPGAEPSAGPAPECPDPAPDPEVVEAERLLLSLRHRNRDLHLGAREARGLAEAAAEWLRRGVSAADLCHALTHALPRTGIRSAVGFLRYRLVEKLPAPVAPPPTASLEALGALGAPDAPGALAPGALVSCDGPGDDHVFRPVGGETRCRRCRTEQAARPGGPPRAPWRTLVEEAAAHALGSAPGGLRHLPVPGSGGGQNEKTVPRAMPAFISHSLP
ncbi:hypothetical protein ACWGIN_06295 [Streptomyces sp. NPDC054861]